MKKKTLLAISCILALGVIGCDKDLENGDASLTGEKVTVGELRDSYTNLYVLSEGLMGANNASLDLFNPASGTYYRNVFSYINFSLGDTANDIIAVGDEIWIAVNGSDLVEVFDAASLLHKSSIPVTSPRFMATDGQNVYVTSYNGAYISYKLNPETNGYDIDEVKNPKGAVVKINAGTKQIAGTVEVGYQPEGVAVAGDKLYVANSGGISVNVTYAYDNTISVIDLETFSASGTLTGEDNAKELFVDSEGDLWEHALGDYYMVHSGLYKITGEGPARITAEGSELCVSSIWKDGDNFWIVGTDDENDWEKETKDYYVYKISGGVATKVNVSINFSTPYGIAVDPDTKDLFLTDGPYGGALGGTYCYSKAKDYALNWKYLSGVFPGHFLFM